MTTIEERAPLAFHTPTERDEIVALLTKAERLSAELADIYRQAQRIVTATSPLVHVDLGDPLAAFRLPSGAVAYVTTYADEVVVGDWVQRCHGDPDWHLVTEVESLPWPDPDWMPFVRVTHDGLAHDWRPGDAIRIARPPADVVAAQERGL